jgi:hypothetical protein
LAAAVPEVFEHQNDSQILFLIRPQKYSSELSRLAYPAGS